MIGIGKTLHYGEKRQGEIRCKCGNQHFWHTTVQRSLKLSIFALLPLKDGALLKCTKCQREYPAQQQNNTHFSQLNLSQRLPQVAGWPFLVLIGLMLTVFYRSVNPDDSQYRVAPKVGDIYFVDYHQITKQERYAGHPYRIARLVAVSDEELELKVSSWSHSKKWGVITDFSTQMYAYKSNYMANTITLAFDSLRRHDEVFSIRRKFNNVDVEKKQKRTEFVKNFFDPPFL